MGRLGDLIRRIRSSRRLDIGEFTEFYQICECGTEKTLVRMGLNAVPICLRCNPEPYPNAKWHLWDDYKKEMDALLKERKSR